MARPTRPGVEPAPSMGPLETRSRPRARHRARVLVVAALIGGVCGAGAQLLSPTAPDRVAPPDHPRLVDPNTLARVSYDGDGRSDIAIQTLGVPGQLLEFSSRGDHFTKPRHWATVPGTVNGARPSRFNADADGDGRTDAITVASDGTDAEVSVLLSDGTAFRTRRVWGSIPGLGSGRVIFASGDFDGDGRSDIAVLRESAAGSGVDISVLRSTGTSYAPPVTWAQDLPWELSYVRIMPGDYTADGRSDLVDAGPDGHGGVQLRVLCSTGSAFAAPQVWATMPDTRWQDLRALPGDFDGDGRDDLGIAVQSGEQPMTVTVFRTRRNRFAPGVRWLSRPGWPVHSSWLTTGDYDGDGRTDLARISDQASGGIALDVSLSTGHSFGPDTIWGSDPGVRRNDMFTLGRLG